MIDPYNFHIAGYYLFKIIFNLSVSNLSDNDRVKKFSYHFMGDFILFKIALYMKCFAYLFSIHKISLQVL